MAIILLYIKGVKAVTSYRSKGSKPTVGVDVERALSVTSQGSSVLKSYSVKL